MTHHNSKKLDLLKKRKQEEKDLHTVHKMMRQNQNEIKIQPKKLSLKINHLITKTENQIKLLARLLPSSLQCKQHYKSLRRNEDQRLKKKMFFVIQDFLIVDEFCKIQKKIEEIVRNWRRKKFTRRSNEDGRDGNDEKFEEMMTIPIWMRIIRIMRIED